jgi:hypothetical protein
MRLYAYEHLKRINLREYAYKNLQRIEHDYCSTKADLYFQPTDEFEHMVQQANIMAALKGQRIVKPVYKSVYKSRRRDNLVWS